MFVVGGSAPGTVGKVGAPTRRGAAASAADLGPGSSPGRPEGTLGLRLENNRR